MPAARASACCSSPPMTRRREAAQALAGDSREIVVEPFGDIWLRDTGADHASATAQARDFGFNGWGGKYDLPGDDDIGARLRRRGGISRPSAATGCSKAARSTATAPAWSSPPSNACSTPTAIPRLTQGEIEARLRDDLGFTERAVARRRAAQRSYRRPCRQSRALRRRPGGSRFPSRRTTIPTGWSISDAAQRARGVRRDRGRPHPLARPRRCATTRSFRRAT